MQNFTPDPNSIDDYLKSTGQDFSHQAKATLYEKNGLGKASDYIAMGANNAVANTKLLNTLRNVPNQLVVSSNPSRIQTMQYSNKLSNALNSYGLSNSNVPNQNNIPNDPTTQPNNTDVNAHDPFIGMLNNMQSTSDTSTKRLISNIQANRARTQSGLANEYENYKRGIQLLGIQHNQAQFTPDILMSHVKQAENEFQSKISDLDREESKALMDAEEARNTNNFRLLKERMDYVDKIRKEKKESLKDFYDTTLSQEKVSDSIAQSIYSVAQGLDNSEKEVFLQQVSQKYKIPLGSLVQSLADLNTSKMAKKSTGTKTGSGTGGTASGGYTALEKRKLRQAGIDPTDTKEADDYLYGKHDDNTYGKPSFAGEQLPLNEKFASEMEKKYNLGTEHLVEIQNLLNKGYSLKQIAQARSFPTDVYNAINKNIIKTKE